MKNRWIISILLLVLVIPSLTIFYDTGWFVFFLSSWIVPVFLIGFYCYEEEEKEKRFSREELFQIFWIFLLIFILTLPFLYIQKAYVDNGIIDLKGKIIVWGLEIAKAPCSKDWDFVFDGILVITEALTFLVGGVLVFEGLRDEIWKFIKKTKIFPKILVLIAIFLRFVFLWKTYDFSIIEGLEYNILFGRISFIFVRSIPFLFITLPLLYIFYFTEKKTNILRIQINFLREILKNNSIQMLLGILVIFLFLFLPFFNNISFNLLFFLKKVPILNRLSLVINFPMASLTITEFFAMLNVLSGALLLLLVPLLNNMFNFETVFENHFNSELRKIIQRAINPILIIGYGNLGTRVGEEFLKRKNNLKLITKKILTPDLDSKEITENLIVVSKDQRAFDRVHTDPIFQDIGVAEIEIEKEEKDSKEKYLIPAIVGDINSGSTRDACKLSECKGFISLVNDERAILTLFDLAYKKDLKAIISMENSPEKEFLICRSPSKDIFLIYPEQEEGIAVGMLLYETLIKFASENTKKTPRILICGRGKQIYYIVETMELMLKRFGPYKEGIGRNWNMRNNLIILSDEQDFDNRAVLLPDKAQNKSDSRLLKEILSRSLRTNEWRYNCFINDSPDREKTMWEILDDPRKIPDVIVISSRQGEEITKITEEWIDVIEKYRNITGNREYKPKIIVGTVGSEEKIIKKDAMIFYGTNITKEKGFPDKFPSQKFDSAINIYKDTKDLISGLTEALSREKKEKIKIEKGLELENVEPTGIYLCVRDVKGGLAEIHARLSNMNYSLNNNFGNNSSPYFYYTRYENCSEKDIFSFESDVILSKNKILEKEPVKAALILNREEKNIRIIRNLLIFPFFLNFHFFLIFPFFLNFHFFLNFPFFLSIPGYRKEDLDKDCLYRVTCPVAAYRRKVKDLLDEVNDRFYGNLILKKVIKNPDIIDTELSRFYLSCEREECTPVDINLPEAPYAKINVCCGNGNIPGSLGFLLSTMIFKEKREKRYRIHDKNYAVDVTYMRTYECYKGEGGNCDYTLQEIYGNILEENEKQFNRRINKLDPSIIRFILIRPITGIEEWKNYAENLRAFLNEQGRRFNIYYTEKYHNLAIVNKDFLGKYSKDEPLDIKCTNKKCVISQRARYFNWSLK